MADFLKKVLVMSVHSIYWPRGGHDYETDLDGVDKLTKNGLSCGDFVKRSSKLLPKILNASCIRNHELRPCARHGGDISGPDQEVAIPAHTTYCASTIGFARAGAMLVCRC